MRHSEKTVVVTGGGSGLGAAGARRFLEDGARVGTVDIRPASDELRAALEPFASRWLHVQADVANRSEVDSAVQSVVERFGPVEVLFANAGRLMPGDGLVHETPVEAWDALLGINLFGALNACKAVLPGMLEARRGVIVLTSSLGARGGSVPAYGCSKAGLLGAMRSIDASYRSHGIRCVAIIPGSIDTPIREHSDFPKGIIADRSTIVQTRVSMRRLGDPAEVGALVSFLASDDAAALTGQIYYVDGGINA